MFNKYKFFLENLKNKSIILLGFGISNRAIYNFINKYCNDITIYDNKNITNKEILLSNTKIIKYFNKNIINKKYDYIFRSPSILPNSNIIKKLNINYNTQILTEVELFIKLCPSKNIIGITGSDGKTTTSTLIYEILKYNNYHCLLGGNIGNPLINEIDKITKNTIIILELSSFQLINSNKSPNISVITNITENHLDIHSSFQEYIKSKINIIKYQQYDDITIINKSLISLISKYINIKKLNLYLFGYNENNMANYIFLDKDNNIIFKDKNFNKIKLFNISGIKLRGSHNIENILSALLATYKFCKFKNVDKVLFDFIGVKHRLEYVKTINNIDFYNDSIATTPNRTIAALKTFDKKIILLIGGYDKKLSYECLIPYIISKVKIIILMGATGIKIENELLKVKHSIKIYKKTLLEEAVKFAYTIIDKNDKNIVLLSPASASFDQFKNFEERGDKFKEIVNSLHI